MSEDVARELSALVETLLKSVQQSQPAEIDDALAEITATAAHALTPAQYAGITVATRGGVVRTASSTGPYPSVLDDIQQRHHEGPCLSAAWEHHIVRIPDLRVETRWPAYCRDAVAHTPVKTVMSFQLFVDHRTMGALNFYAERPHVFDDEAVELGWMLATNTALAWNLLRRDQQFRSALTSRDLIGQAKGMIMERFRVDAVQAFELLRRLSQDSNTPVAGVARRVLDDHERRGGD
ncbi:MAG TPA: GAF and ANTAR domain-containing protein [Mycobacterium sp.]|jgi:transcriptional regulator with GAF, ATPase, and Fis domain|nr:GAF and ANTAR domain-containing protein [Mycobacterium sp.]